MKNKFIIIGAVIFLTFTAITPVFAKNYDRRVNNHRVSVTTTTATTTATTTNLKPGVRNAAIPHVKKVIILKTVQGTVKSVSASSLTLTVRSIDYTINTTSKTRIINRIWGPINLSDINVGDRVRVFGSKTENTIIAQIVRDITLPVHKTILNSATSTASSTASTTAR